MTNETLFNTIKSGEYVDGLLFPVDVRFMRRMVDTACIRLANSESVMERVAGRQTVRSVAENCDMQIRRWQEQLSMIRTVVDRKRAETVIARCHDMIIWCVEIAAKNHFSII